MLRVATVLSAQEWEAQFVAAARESASVRLVLRAYLPDEVSRRADDLDVVVAGAETPWVTPTRIASWRRLGVRVVGIRPSFDRPAGERLTAGGADLVLDADLDPDHLVREIRMLHAGPDVQADRQGRIATVTGIRGGPGRTEVALALAWASSGLRDTAIVDADVAAPGLAVRLGLPPRPDLADFVDATLDGADPRIKTQRVGRLVVVPGPMRSAEVRPSAAIDIAEALAGDSWVIVDAGSWPGSTDAVHAAQRTIFVLDATPLGIVRAAGIVERWSGPPPEIVLNGVRRRFERDVVASTRRWLGLEPVAVVPRRRHIRDASSGGRPPHRSLVRSVCHLVGSAHG